MDASAAPCVGKGWSQLRWLTRMGKSTAKVPSSRHPLDVSNQNMHVKRHSKGCAAICCNCEQIAAAF